MVSSRKGFNLIDKDGQVVGVMRHSEDQRIVGISGIMTMIIFYIILALNWTNLHDDDSGVLSACCYAPILGCAFGVSINYFLEMKAKLDYKEEKEREIKQTQRKQLDLKKKEREKLLKKANLLGFNSIESYNRNLAEIVEKEKQEKEKREKKEKLHREKQDEKELQNFEQRIKELKSRIEDREKSVLKLRNGVTSKQRKEKAFNRHNFQPNYGKISVSKKNDAWGVGTCNHCESKPVEENDCINISLRLDGEVKDAFAGEWDPQTSLGWDFVSEVADYSYFEIVEQKMHADIALTSRNKLKVASILKRASLQDDFENQYLLQNPHIVDDVSFYWTIHPELRVLLLCDSCAAKEGLLADNENHKKEKRSRSISSSVKQAVWQRCEGKCVECGAVEELEFDHIIPHSKGGSNGYNNLQLLCTSCNSRKSDNIE